MTKPFHARFAEALKKELPEGFNVQSDQYLVTAQEPDIGYGLLIGRPPVVADRRSPVGPVEAQEWIRKAETRLRMERSVYTPEAKADADKLLARLEEHRKATSARAVAGR